MSTHCTAQNTYINLFYLFNKVLELDHNWLQFAFQTVSSVPLSAYAVLVPRALGSCCPVLPRMININVRVYEAPNDDKQRVCHTCLLLAALHSDIVFKCTGQWPPSRLDLA